MLNRFTLATAFLLTVCTLASPVQTEPVTSGGSYEINSVLGIEYATAERWELPTLNTDWSAGTDFGPACPQAGQTVMVEDCLFLNIFSPDTDATDLPVLVWFHGGGFIAGEGGTGPKTFARDGVVVVTFNYRLGKLGFHDWAGWDETDPRNFGQADMVAALNWVQVNIAQFGGNPNDVTLAGHSAGGMGVQLMMVDPRAEGKFAHAWSHAGYGSWPFPKAYNPTPEERQRIRYAPLENSRSAAQLVSDISVFHLPFIDAPFLKDQPVDLFGSGKPYVAGANSYDGAGTLHGAGFTPDSFLSQIDSPALREVYAADFAVSKRHAAQQIFGDLRYLLSSAETAQAAKGWLFHYDEIRGDLPGATHGQQYDRLFADAPFAMKEAMLSFIKSGEPGWATLETGHHARFSPELSTAKISILHTRLDHLAKSSDLLKP